MIDFIANDNEDRRAADRAESFRRRGWENQDQAWRSWLALFVILIAVLYALCCGTA
jgi:hypothetical protein